MDNITALLQQNQGIITSSIYKSNNYIYVILLMSPFFIQYCVCIIVNQHLSKWCNNSLNTNSTHKKYKQNANKSIGQETPPCPEVFLWIVTRCWTLSKKYSPWNSTGICIEPTMWWFFFFSFVCVSAEGTWTNEDFWYCKIVMFVKARLRFLTSQALKYHWISIKQSLNIHKGVIVLVLQLAPLSMPTNQGQPISR